MKQLFLFSTMIFIVACTSLGGNKPASLETVMNFKVHETDSPSHILLELSGTVMHSSMVVDRIETKNEPGCLVVKVYLWPAFRHLTRKGYSGSFTHSFDVPSETEAVCFETATHVIWKRDVGPLY